MHFSRICFVFDPNLELSCPVFRNSFRRLVRQPEVVLLGQLLLVQAQELAPFAGLIDVGVAVVVFVFLAALDDAVELVVAFVFHGYLGGQQLQHLSQVGLGSVLFRDILRERLQLLSQLLFQEAFLAATSISLMDEFADRFGFRFGVDNWPSFFFRLCLFFDMVRSLLPSFLVSRVFLDDSREGRRIYLN